MKDEMYNYELDRKACMLQERLDKRGLLKSHEQCKRILAYHPDIDEAVQETVKRRRAWEAARLATGKTVGPPGGC